MDLLIPLAESRARVPFPPIIEVLILEATVEMVREVAICLPTYIGSAISVVAGLIIGEAALKYYEEKYGAEKGMEGIRATKVRLGCHEEIRIYRGNEILMRADYVYGRIYE